MMNLAVRSAERQAADGRRTTFSAHDLYQVGRNPVGSGCQEGAGLREAGRECFLADDRNSSHPAPLPCQCRGPLEQRRDRPAASSDELPDGI